MTGSAEPATRPRVLIGWKELVDLPDLGLSSLKAKVDTGARTTALHVAAVHTLEELGDGRAELEIVLAPDRRHPDHLVSVRVQQLARVSVTDSSGNSQLRPLIETTLVLGPVRKRIRVTLADRSTMLFRMILGRKTLERDFVVDVAEKYLHGRPPLRPRNRPAH